jgi:hypothetical protein
VDQTRQAHDRSTEAFEASVATFEKFFDVAGQGAAAFNRKIIDIARRNVPTSFDLAKSLAGAKNLAEMVELHAAYWRKQIGTLTAQAEEVRELSAKVHPMRPRPSRRIGRAAWMGASGDTDTRLLDAIEFWR